MRSCSTSSIAHHITKSRTLLLTSRFLSLVPFAKDAFVVVVIHALVVLAMPLPFDGHFLPLFIHRPYQHNDC